MRAQRFLEQRTEAVENKSDKYTVSTVVQVSASCCYCCISCHFCQIQLLSAMQLTSNQLPQSALSLSTTLTGARTSNLTSGSSTDAAYVPNFVSLYPGQVTAGGAALVDPDPLAQCLTGPDVVGSESAAAGALAAPSVITHTAVTASQATTTLSQGSVSQQQQQQQTFAMPRPFRPSSASTNKNHNSSMQRIAPAPAPQLFLTGSSIILVFEACLYNHLNSLA